MTNKILTSREILDLPMGDNDAHASTIRDYFVKIAQTVWAEGEGFSGKRPFGNSGWEYEPFMALAKAGLVDCKFDKDGYVYSLDTSAATILIRDALLEL